MEPWSLLVISLPTRATALRTRIWRAVRAMGAATLRDGVYLLPSSAGRRGDFAALAADAVAEGGSGHVLAVAADEDFRPLFDRGAEYGEILAEAEAIPAGDRTEAAKRLKMLRKSLAALLAIDFFPTDARASAEARVADLEEWLARTLTPGEPGWAEGAIRRRDPAFYNGRVWVTRRDLGIDRLASGWLIRRFIDTDAAFVFLDTPAGQAPADAAGFDFDGAEFTHVGGRVSFQTLLAAFALEDDAALTRIGRIVHALDIGGISVPEAAGINAIIAGLHRRLADDHARLDRAMSIFDDLYQA
jgi:hypothetical protein